MSFPFPLFVPPSSYPNIVKEYQVGLLTDPKPTNSWFQTGVSNADNDTVRQINATPWVWIPQYSTQGRPLSLYHNELKNYAINLSNGNFQVSNTPFDAIWVNENTIETKDLKDMSAFFQLKDTGGGNTIKGYPSRGSPFANFNANFTVLSFSFSRGVIASSSASAFDNGGIDGFKHKFTINSAKKTSVTEQMIPLKGDTFTTTKMSIYDDASPTNSIVTVIGTESEVGIQFHDFGFTLIVSRESNTGIKVTGPTPDSLIGHWSNKGVHPSIWGASFVRDGVTYELEYTLLQINRFAALSITKPIVYTFILYLPGQENNIIAVSSNNKTINSTANYTGNFQFIIIPPGLSNTAAANLESFYDTYAFGGLIEFGTSSYSSTTFRLDMEVLDSDVDSLVLLPRHWNDYTIVPAGGSSGTKIANPAGYTPNSITYGDLYFYKVSTNAGGPFTLDVNVPNLIIPDKPDVSTFTTGELSALTKRILIDTGVNKGIYSMNVDADPYTFGQQAATVGQICVLAKALTDQGVTEPELLFNVGTQLYKFRDALFKAMKTWLQSNNLPRYRLHYDNRWKGVLVPADSLGGPGAYGNTFYNDHHFHYGYFAYAIWALIHTGIDMSTFGDQIEALMLDVCNPSSSSTFSTKVRHKDFYGGHSWASGIGRIINEAPVGFVNRQQESSGEAINCYYSCYLLSKILSLASIRNTASLVLKMELDASKYYYQLQAPGSKFGDFTKVAGIGILQSFGKAFTLDWPMQPNTFPGRTLGLYGIQSLPFTEISFTHVSSEWSDSIKSTSDVLYRVTPDLVKGLTDDVYVPLFPPSSTPFNTKLNGGYWGNVGLMMLAPGDLVDVDTQTLWSSWINILDKQTTHPGRAIKSFDSYSNTLYWLMRNGIFKTDKKVITVLTVFSTKLLPCLKVVGKYRESTGHMKMRIMDKCKVKCIIVPLRDLIKGEDSHTLSEKALHLDTTVLNIMECAMVKITINFLCCGTMDPSKVLASSNDVYVMNQIKKNGCCLYLKILSRYEDCNEFFV